MGLRSQGTCKRGILMHLAHIQDVLFIFTSSHYKLKYHVKIYFKTFKKQSNTFKLGGTPLLSPFISI